MQPSKVLLVLGSFMAFLFTGSGEAATQTFVLSNASARFEAIGKPGFLRIHGRDARPTGKVVLDGKNATGEFRCQLDTFHTGIELCDKHMTEQYLQTDKYPEAVLVLKEFALKESGENLFKATLVLHGVMRDVEGEASAVLGGNALSVEAHFSIDLNDYKIDIPSFSGITVAQTVKVSVSFSAEAITIDNNQPKNTPAALLP